MRYKRFMLAMMGVLFALAAIVYFPNIAQAKWKTDFIVKKDGGKIVYSGTISENGKECWIKNITLEVPRSVRKLIIPSTIKKAKVVSIGAVPEQGMTLFGETASMNQTKFEKYYGLQRIVLPKSIKTIQKYTFYGLIGLKSVNIPSGVKSIEDHVFYGCKSLQSIYIPRKISYIETGTFGKCLSLKKITMAKSNKYFRVTKVGIFTKDGNMLVTACPGLTKVKITSNCKTIGSYAFAESRVDTVTISYGVKRIEDYAFVESSVKNLAISSSIKYIGKNIINGYKIKKITVARGNKTFSKVDQSIFKKKTGALVIQIVSNGPDVTIAKGVKSISKNTMFVGADVKYMYSVSFPKTLKALYNGWSYNAGADIASLSFLTKDPKVIKEGAISSMFSYPNIKLVVPANSKIYYLSLFKRINASKVEVVEKK